MRVLQQLLEDNAACWLVQGPSKYFDPIRPTAAAQGVDTGNILSCYFVPQKYWRDHLTVRAKIQTTFLQSSFRRACANCGVTQLTEGRSCRLDAGYDAVTSSNASPLCTSKVISWEISLLEDMAVLEMWTTNWFTFKVTWNQTFRRPPSQCVWMSWKTAAQVRNQIFI